MEQSKEKEVKTLNLVLMALAALSVAVAAWTIASNGFRAGTDDLFLIIVCLVLALLFSIVPLLHAKETGRLKEMFGVDDEEPEALHAHAAEEHAHGGSDKQNIIVWGGLLGLTAFEVFLAYEHINQTLMLLILMLLSIVKAALIIAYFMHMKFERLSFILTVVPTLVVLLCLFAIFFPDSNRLHKLRPPESVEQVEPGTSEAK